MKDLTSILSGFKVLDTLSVKEVANNNRLETKFLLKADSLPLLLEALRPNYSLLQFGTQPVAAYTTSYFDTPDFNFYMAHHNGRIRRWKVRERTYENTNKIFLEIKQQSCAGRVIKTRMKRNELTKNWQKNEIEFLMKNLPFSSLNLIPVLSSQYRRIALADKDLTNRVTIDLELQFSTSFSQLKLSDFIIVEVKQENKGSNHAILALKRMRIRPVALSKYCLGINYLYPDLKKNNFKPRLRTIKKLIHERANSYTDS